MAPDSIPPDPTPREPTLSHGSAAPSQSDDSAWSVDQLTHAFAQLLGHDDDSPADGSSPSNGAEQVGASGEDDPLGASESDLDAQRVSPAAVLEAVLFVGHPQNEPLTSRRLAGFLRGVSPQEVETWIDQLNQQYDEQHAPYRIATFEAGYRLELRDEYARLRDSFHGRVREARLSQVAVDLLAIVAYHQPISREEIDRLRGQASGATLAQLVRRQLLKVNLQADQLRTKLYCTTDRFLDLFGLDSLEDLPSQEDL